MRSWRRVASIGCPVNEVDRIDETDGNGNWTNLINLTKQCETWETDIVGDPKEGTGWIGKSGSRRETGPGQP